MLLHLHLVADQMATSLLCYDVLEGSIQLPHLLAHMTTNYFSIGATAVSEDCARGFLT